MAAGAGTAIVELNVTSPFRIVARHPDEAHHDHEWAQIGGLHDDVAEAQEVIDAAKTFALPTPGGVAIAARVKIAADHRVAEAVDLGYEVAIEGLAISKTAKDGVPLEHAWVPVDEQSQEVT